MIVFFKEWIFRNIFIDTGPLSRVSAFNVAAKELGKLYQFVGWFAKIRTKR